MKEIWLTKAENNNPNYIGSIKISKKILESGLVIPNKYTKRFITNLSESYKNSSTLKLSIVIDKENFETGITIPENSTDDNIYLRLFFKDELKDYINKKVHQIVLSNNEELILEFYVGDKENNFKLELIKIDKDVFVSKSKSVIKGESNEEAFKNWLIDKSNFAPRTCNSYISCIRRADTVLGTDTFSVDRIGQIE